MGSVESKITNRYNGFLVALYAAFAGQMSSTTLQKDWNEVGDEGFKFEILDTITVLEQTDYDPTQDLRALRVVA